jgi:hypothetical protein
MSQKQKVKKDKTVKTTAKTKDKTKHSIPTVGSGPPSNRPNVLSRFAKKVKPNTKTVAKKDRPKLPIPSELEDKLKSYAPLKKLTDLLEARRMQEAKELGEEIWQHYIKFLWAKQKAPETPRIEARDENGKVDCQSLYMVQQGLKIKINMPPMDDDADAVEVFISTLVDLGVTKDDARNFVESELDLTPQWNIPITSLITGDNEVLKRSAEKLFLWLQGEDEDGNELDDDAPLVLDTNEKAALADHVNDTANCDPKLLDPKDFLDRVCGYFNSCNDVSAVLSMVTPTHYLTRTEFGISSSETEKAARLKEEAANIVGDEIANE